MTTVTSIRDATSHLTSTTTAVQQQRSDAVVIALLGLGTVFALTGITAGRIKLTFGGVSTDIVAVAAKAGQTIGELKALAPDDPETSAAVERWKDYLDGLRK